MLPHDVPLKAGGSAEIAVLGWQWFDHGGETQLHLAGIKYGLNRAQFKRCSRASVGAK